MEREPAEASRRTGAVPRIEIAAAHFGDHAGTVYHVCLQLLGKLIDHRSRVLVADGKLRRGELRRRALTDNDLYTQLRQREVFSH